MTEQLSKAELSGESYPKVTGGRHQKWSSEWRSSPELTEPLCNCSQSPADHHQQASWPQIRQKCSPRFLRYSTLTNHLMIFFQQEFSLSWAYKNWLLTHENHWLSLEPVHSSNGKDGILNDCFAAIFSSYNNRGRGWSELAGSGFMLGYVSFKQAEWGPGAKMPRGSRTKTVFPSQPNSAGISNLLRERYTQEETG